MKPRPVNLAVCALALGTVAFLAVRSALAGTEASLVPVAPVTATQDAEGYVRIDFQLRNESGHRVRIVSTEGASFRWAGREARLESLRILQDVADGAVVDASFETISHLPPVATSDDCRVQLDVFSVREESSLDDVLGFPRLARSRVEMQVEVSEAASR